MIVNGPLDIAGFEHVTSDPVTNLFEGRQIYRTDTKESKVYRNSVWGLFPGEALISSPGLINPTNSSSGFVYSSLWTPTYDAGNSINVTTASAQSSRFIRIGTHIFFTARLRITGAGNNLNIITNFTLPVASNFSSSNQLSGTLSVLVSGGLARLTGIAEADTANDQMAVRMRGDVTSSDLTYIVSGSYQIIA